MVFTYAPAFCTGMHEGSVNASFRVEDGLQLLQMVVDGLRYETAFVMLPELVANYRSQPCYGVHLRTCFFAQECTKDL